MRGITVGLAFFAAAILVAAAASTNPRGPGRPKDRLQSPARRLRLDDRQDRRPGRLRAGRRARARRRSSQPRSQRRYAGPRRPRTPPGLHPGGPEGPHPHRLLRHRRPQRCPAQERSPGREVAGQGHRYRRGHGRQGHPGAVLRQGRAPERPGRDRRRRRRPEAAGAEGRGPGRRPGPRKLSQRRGQPEDPRAGRIARRPGLLRRRQFPGRGLSHPRRDPPARGAYRGSPCQGHQGPLRQRVDGLPGRPQGAGGHRLQGLVRPGGHQDAARRRRERSLRHRLPEGRLRHLRRRWFSGRGALTRRRDRYHRGRDYRTGARRRDLAGRRHRGGHECARRDACGSRFPLPKRL